MKQGDKVFIEGEIGRFLNGGGTVEVKIKTGMGIEKGRGNFYIYMRRNLLADMQKKRGWFHWLKWKK